MKTKKFLLLTPMCAVLSALLMAATPLQAMAADTVQLVSREIAIETAQAKVTGTLLQCNLDSDDGRLLYDIEILDTSGYKYDIAINAFSGDVTRTWKETKKMYSYQQYKNPKISWSTALTTAQKSVEGSTAHDFELDRDWNRLAYDISVFDADGVEYDILVDAGTGEIISSVKDTFPAGVSATVTRAAANQTALDNIGGGLILNSKLDYDDGALYYEVKAVSNAGTVYDFEISATTGSIMDQEQND